MKAIAHLAFSLGSAIHNLWFINGHTPEILRDWISSVWETIGILIVDPKHGHLFMDCQYTHLKSTYAGRPYPGHIPISAFKEIHGASHVSLRGKSHTAGRVHLEEPKVEDVMRSAQVVLPSRHGTPVVFYPEFWEHFSGSFSYHFPSISYLDFRYLPWFKGLSQRFCRRKALEISSHDNLRPYPREKHISSVISIG